MVYGWFEKKDFVIDFEFFHLKYFSFFFRISRKIAILNKYNILINYMKPENFFQLNLPYGMEWGFTPPIRWDANAILCSPIIIMG